MDRKTQAAIRYLNTLYNMNPDAQLLQAMKKASDEKQIPHDKWMRNPIQRFCRE